jgi:hypothetical protein
MYLIKVCPSCKTKLRFPIDKGTIRVTCACGYSFIANPDDTGIYHDASFDLSRTRCGLKKMAPFRKWIGGIRVKGLVPFLITGLLDVKYRFQNFRLLPAGEKKKLIVALLVLGAVVLLAVGAICLLSHPGGAPDKIII